MKKTLIIAIALSVCFVAFSQEKETAKTSSSNELRLNISNTIVLFPELTYERCFANDFGAGLSAAISLGYDMGDEAYAFQITPFFRFYFGSKPSSGFFIEPNIALVGFKTTEIYLGGTYPYYSSSTIPSRTITDFGFGFAFGYKYFNRRNLVGELYAGIGRTLENRVYPRLGISLGVRF
jgi:hypothetical protein